MQRIHLICSLAAALVLPSTVQGAEDSETLHLVASVESKRKPHTLAFSPDGKMIAGGSGYTESIGSHGEVTVWKVPSLEPILEYKGHKADVAGVAFTPTSDKLVSGASEIIVLDMQTKDVDSVLRNVGLLHAFQLSPDGHTVATICSERIGRIHIWDLRSERRVALLTCCPDDSDLRPFPHELAFSLDGSILASADHSSTVTLWRTADWSKMTSIPITPLEKRVDSPRHIFIDHLRYSLIDNRLFVGGEIGLFYDTLKGSEVCRLDGPEGLSNYTPWSISYATDVAWSRDGKVLAAVHDSKRGYLSLWNATTGGRMATQGGSWRAVAFSPDAKLLAAARTDGRLELFAVREMQKAEGAHRVGADEVGK